MSSSRRIYNPVTGHYYPITERSSICKKRGQIKGLWSKKHNKNTDKLKDIDELIKLNEKLIEKYPDGFSLKLNLESLELMKKELKEGCEGDV